MNWITTWEQIFCILFIWQTNFEPEKSASRTFLLLKPGSFSPPGSWREGMWCPPRLPMLKRLPWMSYVYAKLFAGVLEFKWFGIQRNVLFSQRFVDTSLGVGKTCSKSITSFKWSPIVACFLSSLTLEPLSIFHPPFSLHSQITPPTKKNRPGLCLISAIPRYSAVHGTHLWIAQALWRFESSRSNSPHCICSCWNVHKRATPTCVLEWIN